MKGDTLSEEFDLNNPGNNPNSSPLSPSGYTIQYVCVVFVWVTYAIIHIKQWQSLIWNVMCCNSYFSSFCHINKTLLHYKQMIPSKRTALNTYRCDMVAKKLYISYNAAVCLQRQVFLSCKKGYKCQCQFNIFVCLFVCLLNKIFMVWQVIKWNK